MGPRQLPGLGVEPIRPRVGLGLGPGLGLWLGLGLGPGSELLMSVSLQHSAQFALR